ncbi:MAG: iron dependent repressor, metal binding and dimerization domain protein [Candidatus Fimivivens sp.]|nr:iron dependent repressor, metal binding and dimerization domain protein [Candidatus Fimivivens sp.]
MDKSSGFYTLKGYQLNTQIELTTAMEDYLEMIYRITLANNRIKVSDLSKRLHVKPSSVTKMLQQLNHVEYIKTEKYGDITITEKGRRMGEYLLYRHDVIHRFLCILNHSENELEQVEKIEHFLDEKTVRNIDLIIEKLKKENLNSQPK